MATNLLNPKVGVFYITFSLLLVLIHVVLGLTWFALLIASTVPLARWLKLPSAIKTLDRVTGAVFLMFGAKLVVSNR